MTDSALINNIIHDNGYGIDVTTNGSATFNNNETYNNTTGIRVNSIGGNPYFSSNNSHNNTGTGLIITGDNAEFAGNAVENNGGKGVEMELREVEVNNSHFCNNTLEDIDCGDSLEISGGNINMISEGGNFCPGSISGIITTYQPCD